MVCHTGAVLISESHYFPKYRDSIHGVLVFQHYTDLLQELISLVLFIEVFVQAHVDESSYVCRCLQMHHLPGRCINLVWFSISELHRQTGIFDHQHVPHLRLPYLVVGAGELEHAAKWILHFLLFEVYKFALIPICGESCSATTEPNLKWKI